MRFAKARLAVLTVTASVALSSVALAKSVEDFVNDAVQGDISDVKLGQLAAQKGHSFQVKTFGKTLVTDHAKAQKDAEKTAAAVHATPPAIPTQEAQQEYDKLSGLTGKAFDDEFVRYMADDHRKVIQDFEDEAGVNDGKASAMARRQLPTFQKHLKIAESLTDADAGGNTAPAQ